MPRINIWFQFNRKWNTRRIGEHTDIFIMIIILCMIRSFIEPLPSDQSLHGKARDWPQQLPLKFSELETALSMLEVLAALPLLCLALCLLEYARKYFHHSVEAWRQLLPVAAHQQPDTERTLTHIPCCNALEAWGQFRIPNEVAKIILFILKWTWWGINFAGTT